MIGLIISIILSFWVAKVVKRGGGEPVGWVVGTILLWPVFSMIVGVKYEEPGLMVVGGSGIFLLIAVFFFVL